MNKTPKYQVRIFENEINQQNEILKTLNNIANELAELNATIKEES